MNHRSSHPILVALAFVSLLALPPLAVPGLAQPGASPPPGRTGVRAADTTSPTETPEALTEVGFDQRLGEEIPLELTFLDEAGEPVRLGSYFGARPVVLVPVYYDCPMLCTLVMNSVASSLASIDFKPGRDFDVVAFSFDPQDTPELAREKKRLTLLRYDRPEEGGGGWHFLSPAAGPEGEEAIRRLTESIGFRYTRNESTGEFAHTAGIVVATPEGRIARYFFGLEYPGRDVRLSMVEAADGRIGSLADQVFLYCFRYDPATGKYSALSLNLVRTAAILTVIVLVGFLALALRRERTHQQNTLGTA